MRDPDTRDVSAVTAQSECLEVSLARDSGQYTIVHTPTGQVWSGPGGRLCSLTLIPNDGRPKSGYERDLVKLVVGELLQVESDGKQIRAVFVPDGVSTARTDHRIEFCLTLSGRADLELSTPCSRMIPPGPSAVSTFWTMPWP